MLHYTENLIGTLTIEQRGRQFEIQIRESNCLAAFIHVCKEDDGYRHTLYTFFGDAKHLKNIIKNNGTPFADNVVKLRLNMKYKECYTILRYLVPFYNVECYHE